MPSAFRLNQQNGFDMCCSSEAPLALTPLLALQVLACPPWRLPSAGLSALVLAKCWLVCLGGADG